MREREGYTILTHRYNPACTDFRCDNCNNEIQDGEKYYYQNEDDEVVCETCLKSPEEDN